MKLLLRSALPLTAILLSACQSTPPAPAGPDRFAMADVDKDGELTRGEWSDYVVGGIFADRDTNGDGAITKLEWNPQITPDENKLFNDRDANKDGKVTLAEARTYARRSGTYSGDAREADKNGNGTVNRKEALAYYASKEGPVR